MFKKLSMIGAALAMTAGMVIPTASAEAQYYGGRSGYSDGYRGDSYRDEYRGQYRGDGYRSHRQYRGNRYDGYRSRSGYRCRGGSGTTGTIIGAIAGGLLGNAAVGRRGDNTAGTIVGAGVGALAGRAIDRSDNRC